MSIPKGPMGGNGLHQESSVESLVAKAPLELREPEFLDITPEDAPHLLDYWHVILKRRWVILSCFLIVFSTVGIGTLKQKPVYEGKVLLEISPEPPNVLNFKEFLQVDNQDVDSYRETQFKILQSRSLAEKVVGDLKLYLLPDFYRRSILFGLIKSDPETVPSPSDPGPPDPSSEAFRNSTKNFIDSLNVDPIQRSNLVQVDWFSHDPNLARRVANQLASDYIDQNLQVKWDETQKASDWLQGQLVDLKGKLEKSEDELQAYAQKNGILFLTTGDSNGNNQDQTRQDTASLRLEELEDEYTKAQADRIQKQAVYDMVQKGAVENYPGFLDNPLIQNTTYQLADLQRQYAQLTSVVKPDFPRAVALKKQIDSVQTALDQEKASLVKSIVDGYQASLAREKYLSDAIEAQQHVLNDLTQRMVQYNILKREVDTNKQLYEGLLERLKQAQVSAGLKASNIRVVDAAELPQVPVKPRVLLNLFLGVILGTGLGVGVAFFQEYLDKTLKSPDEVETLIRLPSLGVLPSFGINGARRRAEVKKLTGGSTDTTHPVAQGIQSDPGALEAFRSLRTSILLSAKPVPKVLLITSSFPSEGKTSTTVNLGATLASLGSKVLIVDCDMRRPACHRAVGVQNNPGFVQCLTGHVELRDAILPVPSVANLSIIPCGPIPPNPAEVLSSPVAGELLTKLRADFDYVLVDSPPLLSVADSRILARISDAVVLVVRAYSTPYNAVRQARALLNGASARILGVALNDVDLQRGGYYGYKSYYRYGYGYGYGYGSDEGVPERPEEGKRT